MKNVFKVAVLQKKSINQDFEKNTNTVIEEMKKAAKLGADILLLPECFITGYYLPINNSQTFDINSELMKKICVRAKEMTIGVVATAFTKGETKPRNSAFVIDKNGEIILQYDKVHTCDFAEEACLESGNQFKVCNFHGVEIGIMICYDREYPESARVLMMKGAEIILVPNDCGSMAPRLQALSTRAYENMLGVVMANPPSYDGGNSCAYSAICWDKNGKCVDNTLFLADNDTSGLFLADFDIEKLRKYRRSEMMGNTFRKVKAYDELVNMEIREPFIRNK